MTRTHQLRGKQRKYLRGLAHALRPVVQLGKDGFNKMVRDAVAEALAQHELIKVSVGRPEIGKKAMADQIAERCGAENCGLIGHCVILYRPHPEEPQIKLPEAAANES